MSISASEEEELAESERDRSGSEGPSDLQEDLIIVMNKAVQELELAWNPPVEPVKSKLDSWYFRSSRCQLNTRTSVPVFPVVHYQLVIVVGSSPLSDTGHVLSGGRGGSPRVCAHAPRRGDSRCTPVPCIGRNHPTLQTMQDDSPSSQQKRP